MTPFQEGVLSFCKEAGLDAVAITNMLLNLGLRKQAAGGSSGFSGTPFQPLGSSETPSREMSNKVYNELKSSFSTEHLDALSTWYKQNKAKAVATGTYGTPEYYKTQIDKLRSMARPVVTTTGGTSRIEQLRKLKADWDHAWTIMDKEPTFFSREQYREARARLNEVKTTRAKITELLAKAEASIGTRPATAVSTAPKTPFQPAWATLTKTAPKAVLAAPSTAAPSAAIKPPFQSAWATLLNAAPAAWSAKPQLSTSVLSPTAASARRLGVLASKSALPLSSAAGQAWASKIRGLRQVVPSSIAASATARNPMVQVLRQLAPTVLTRGRVRRI